MSEYTWRANDYGPTVYWDLVDSRLRLVGWVKYSKADGRVGAFFGADQYWGGIFYRIVR